jgi:5-methyltetrahydrofolate--homocysteine methyltransferase
MSRFREMLHAGNALLMDGAMGTELRRAGLPDDACGEGWNLTEPARVRAVHRAYVEAGAACLLTNTFQANPPALARHGLAGQFEPILRAAVALARDAAGRGRLVLGSVGPGIETALADGRAPALAAFRGVDGLLLETFSEVPAAVIAACAAFFAEDVPVLVSVTYRRTPAGELCTLGGECPEHHARRVRSGGVAALGVNCGRDVGMDDVIEIVRRYRRETDLPLFARPNAGTPVRGAGGWVYPRTPADMAARLPELLDAGAVLVGGCCGTTPAHVAAFRPVVEAWNARPRRSGGKP